MTATETPILTQTYAAVFAGQLVETLPHTQQHLEAWDTYTLATVAAAGEAALHLSAEELNADYLRRLSQAAQHAGAALLIPPLSWRAEQWNQQARIARANVVLPRGFRAETWDATFQGMLDGVVTLHDTRRYDVFSAFVRLG